MPIVVYGPRPGTEVRFDLTVTPPASVPDGKGGEIKLPPKEGVDGDTVTVTARVPSEADRRELNQLLGDARLESDGGTGFRIRTTRQALEEHQRAVIKKLLVRLDGYSIDPGDGGPPFEVHTPDEVVEHVERDVLNAIVDVLTDRLRLSEVLRKNSDGRSPSSTAATPPLDGTAASAGSSGSAESGRATARRKTRASTSRASG